MQFLKVGKLKQHYLILSYYTIPPLLYKSEN